MSKTRFILPRIALGLVALLALLAVIAACGGGDEEEKTPTGTTTGGATTVNISLEEFKVKASRSSAAPGTVTFSVKNGGVIAHDFWVIQSNLAVDKLPVKEAKVDVSTVTVVNKILELAKDKSESLKVNLAAGKYILICNVATHYEAGMRTAFEVK